jgi:hypothetical protein
MQPASPAKQLRLMLMVVAKHVSLLQPPRSLQQQWRYSAQLPQLRTALAEAV